MSSPNTKKKYREGEIRRKERLYNINYYRVSTVPLLLLCTIGINTLKWRLLLKVQYKVYFDPYLC